MKHKGTKQGYKPSIPPRVVVKTIRSIRSSEDIFNEAMALKISGHFPYNNGTYTEEFWESQIKGENVSTGDATDYAKAE